MKIEIPENKKLVYEMRIPIRWGDMDAMGHVNNTTYFRYLETIRIDWMRSIGCQPDPQGEGPVIVNAFCNFYKQLEYPGDVLVKMYVSDPGRSTLRNLGHDGARRGPRGDLRGRRRHDGVGEFPGAEVGAAAGLDARASVVTLLRVPRARPAHRIAGRTFQCARARAWYSAAQAAPPCLKACCEPRQYRILRADAAQVECRWSLTEHDRRSHRSM